MQVNNNNINSMIQLEKRLEESAKELSKLTLDNDQSNDKDNNELSSKNKQNNEVKLNDTNIVQEIVKQIEIPLAYNAKAEVISMQNSVTRNLLDIKA